MRHLPTVPAVPHFLRRVAAVLLLIAAAPAQAEFLDCVFDGAFDSSGMATSEAGAAVAMHNCARRTVDPPASTPIEPLAWDVSIASMAQSYANQCHFAHSGTPGYGENIYAAAGFTPAIEDAVTYWAGEEPFYDYPTNTCSPSIQGTCGHYTQIVWSGSANVGCGKAYCKQNSPFGAQFPNWYLVVCNYSPAGNNGGRPY